MLNAFRHHRVLRSVGIHKHRTENRVLNAFRHHRVLRPGWQWPDVNLPECSTPFGIIGCYARPRIKGTSSRTTSAQRLSAS